MTRKSQTFGRNGTLSAFLAIAAFAGMATGAQAALVISTGATSNVTCASHVCTATSSDAVFNVKRLQNQLATGKMKLVSGSAAGDIVIDASLTWVSANTLTLDAYHSVIVNQPVSVTGSGGLTLTTNDGGTGGVFSFGAQGNVTFWSLSDHLKINGHGYTLVNTIAALASGIAANSKGHYALAADYDASVDGTYASAPIPTNYVGTFEGLGNKISHIKIIASAEPNVALFSEIDAGGTIRDIGIVDAIIKNRMRNATVGALAAYNRGTIFGAYASGSIVSHVPAVIGGLVACNCGGALTHSYATVSVTDTADSSVGGLVGANIDSIIDSCFATGTVSGGNRSFAGGLVGETLQDTISNSYAIGSITGGKNTIVGGFVGKATESSISVSYSTGAVVAAAGPDTLTGGLLGWNNFSTATQSYWDTTTSGMDGGVGQGDSSGITGLTTEELQSTLPTGFDPSIWSENATINSGLPYLIANSPP